MTNAKLATKGWETQTVEPGNCVQARWTKEVPGLKAVITQTKDGIEGLVKAAEDVTDAKKRGEFIVKELDSVDAAVEIIDKLMHELTADVPHEDAPMLLASSA